MSNPSTPPEDGYVSVRRSDLKNPLELTHRGHSTPPEPEAVQQERDADVIAAIRTELWSAMRGRDIGGDRTLVGMVKRLIAERDEARENRRGEFDLREQAEHRAHLLGEQLAALSVPSGGSPDLREMSARWRRTAWLRSNVDGPAYETCADELDAALSSSVSPKGE